MSIQLEIPDHIAQAMRLPFDGQKSELLVELAISLYGRGILSFGKARELAALDKYEFGILLGKRHIPRHYETEDLHDDLRYARNQ